MQRRLYKEYGRCNIHRSKKKRNPSRKKENSEEAWGKLALSAQKPAPHPKPTVLKALNPCPDILRSQGHSLHLGVRLFIQQKKAQSHAGSFVPTAKLHRFSWYLLSTGIC